MLDKDKLDKICTDTILNRIQSIPKSYEAEDLIAFEIHNKIVTLSAEITKEIIEKYFQE